jgi:hypothetical protein
MHKNPPILCGEIEADGMRIQVTPVKILGFYLVRGGLCNEKPNMEPTIAPISSDTKAKTAPS